MDHLYAMRDLGVSDPADDVSGEKEVRAALVREIESAAIIGGPVRTRRNRPRLLAGATLTAAAVAAAVTVLVGSATNPPPAFAVTRDQHGAVSLTINRATSIDAVNRRLAAMGIEKIGRHPAAAGEELSSIPSCSAPIPAGWKGEWEQMVGSISGPGYTIDETVPPGTWVLVLCASGNPNPVGTGTTLTTGNTGSATGNTGSGNPGTSGAG